MIRNTEFFRALIIYILYIVSPWSMYMFANIVIKKIHPGKGVKAHNYSFLSAIKKRGQCVGVASVVRGYRLQKFDYALW